MVPLKSANYISFTKLIYSGIVFIFIKFGSTSFYSYRISPNGKGTLNYKLTFSIFYPILLII